MANLLNSTLRLYRDAYSGHPREVWTLVILTFINRLGMMVIPFLTVYLTTILGFTLQEAGTLAAAFGFGSLGGSYLGGKLHARFGTQIVIASSISIGGLFLFCLQFTTSFYGIWSLIFLAALFGEAYRPAMSLAIGEHVSKTEMGRSFSLIRLSINLGMAAGPAIGGFVAAYYSYRWLFIIDGVSCVVAGLYFAWAARHWHRKRSADTEEKASENTEVAPPPYKNRRYLLFLLMTFCMGFGFVQWFHTVPYFIKAEWHLDERYIGALMAMGSILIALIEMPAIHSIEKAGRTRRFLKIGMGLLLLSFLPFLLPSHLAWATLAMVILTMGEIFVLPFNNAIQVNLSPDAQRGIYTSWYWMTWSTVIILGPWLGLLMVDWLGFPEFWLLIMGILGLAFFLNHRLKLG